jgi:hypothetical protein
MKLSKKTSSRFLIAMVSVVVPLVACSPIPLIQSPRIDSKFAVSGSIKTSGINNSINFADEDIRKKDRFVVDETIPMFITIGIRNRVEFSGVIFPYYVYGPLWQGNAKVNLFDIGKANFKNLASALFIGSTGYYGEHEDKLSYYGGMSLGTIVKTGIGEFEFVAQSSISNEREHSFESSDRYNIDWLQPALGIICKPGRQQLLQLNAGINYSYPLRSDVLYTLYDQPAYSIERLTNTAHGGFSVLTELKLTIIR